VVLVDRAVDDSVCCSVSVDDVEGGALALTHLIEQGHRQIAFVGGPLGVNQVQDRLLGARQALKSAGLPDTSLLVLETTALNVNEGRRAGERLAGLPQARRPTAAFCANDLLALGFLQEMTRLGVAVPDEVAIVGYDDIDFASAAAVPLTSVRQPRHVLGRTAAELLLVEAAAGPAHRHRQVRFQPELAVRASSRSGPRPAQRGEQFSGDPA
jgi:LacI family transcriptional regulator